MNQSPFSADSSQINLLKNLDDIDDIFNGLAQDDGAQLDQDFEDFLECFSDEDESDEESNYRPFPSFRNISPSFQFSTFAESDQIIKKQTEERLLIPPTGDNQYPQFDEQNKEDSVEEEDDLSDFFDSFDGNMNNNQNKDDDVNYIEIKYFDETYKIPIFTAKLFEPEQPLEDRLLFENPELVRSKFDYKDFPEHLEIIQNMKKIKDYAFAAMILRQQSTLFHQLLEKFLMMKEVQKKWLTFAPSIICESKVEQYVLQLKQFQESVNYVLDYSQNKLTSRRFFDKQKPAYFQDTKKEIKKKEQSEDERILELQKIPYSQTQKSQSCLVGILQFKALQLFETFQQFLHYKKNQEKYKEIVKRYNRMKCHFKFLRMFDYNSIKLIPKKKQCYYKALKDDENERNNNINNIFYCKPMQNEGNELSDKIIQQYRALYSSKIEGITKQFVKSEFIQNNQGKYKLKYTMNKFQISKSKYISEPFLQFTQEYF